MVKKRMGLISLFISVLLVFSSLCLNTFAEAETSAADTETVTETDENGVPLEKSNELTFTYTVEGGDVVLNYENNRAEVVITNEFEEVTPTVTPAGDITETPGGSDDSHTTSTYVKTGDDTPIGLYVTLLVLAACAVVAAVVLAKKKGKTK